MDAVIIALTYSQLQACRRLGTERHKEYLAGQKTHSKDGHLVGMPPVAWLRLVEILQTKAFHPSGRHRKRGNQRDGIAGTRAAVTRIWGTLVEARSHPALRGEAMLGSFGTVMLAWPTAPRSRLWGLFPNDLEPSILAPETRLIQGSHVTAWSPLPVGSLEIEGAFLDPESHFGWDVDVDVVVELGAEDD